MKIRTLVELEDAIDRDLKDRKRALTTLKFAFDGSRPHERAVLGPAAVVILYAHWEGFLKHVGQCYTRYVSQQGLTYDRVSDGILAACLRSKIKQLRDANTILLHKEVVQITRDNQAVADIPWKSAIETYDNVDSRVLSEIVSIVGCDAAPYLTRATFVDEKLLKHRNCIAHNGLDHELDLGDIPEMFNTVHLLLEQFGRDVRTAAQARLFQRQFGS